MEEKRVISRDKENLSVAVKRKSEGDTSWSVKKVIRENDKSTQLEAAYTAWVNRNDIELRRLLKELTLLDVRGFFNTNKPKFVRLNNLTKDDKSGRRQLRHEVIVARATWQTNLKTSKNKKWNFGRTNLLDGHDRKNQIRLSAFDTEAYRMLNTIKVGDMVWIENFEIQKTMTQYRTVPNKFEVSLCASSKIYHLADDMTIAREMIYSFDHSIKDIIDMPYCCFDLRAILMEFGQPYKKTSFWTKETYLMRDLWFVDESKFKDDSNDDNAQRLKQWYKKESPINATPVILKSGSDVSRSMFALAKDYLDQGMNQSQACKAVSTDLGMNVYATHFSVYMKQFRPSKVYTCTGPEKYHLAHEYVKAGMSQNSACKAASLDVGYTVHPSRFGQYLKQFRPSQHRAPNGNYKYEVAKSIMDDQQCSQADACAEASSILGYSFHLSAFARYLATFRPKRLYTERGDAKYKKGAKYVNKGLSHRRAAEKVLRKHKIVVNSSHLGRWIKKNNPTEFSSDSD